MDRKLLSQDVVDVMNYRIQQEEFSARLYEQMKMWFDNKGYKNLSKLYEEYVNDEMTHAGWAKSYLLDYGIVPQLKPLASPYVEYKDCKDIFNATLEHEQVVTSQVAELASKSLKIGNFVLHALALKYCAEQQEEIGKSINLLDIHALTGDGLVLDQYVGENLLA